AFLIDAETRLNPSIATGYFGATQSSPARPAAATPSLPTPTEFMKLSPADRELATRQKICPVTDEPLGSMGVPFKVVIDGLPVFLCCDGCEDELRTNWKKYRDKVQRK